MMGSSESKSKQTVSASDVSKSGDDGSSLDERAMYRAGMETAIISISKAVGINIFLRSDLFQYD